MLCLDDRREPVLSVQQIASGPEDNRFPVGVIPLPITNRRNKGLNMLSLNWAINMVPLEPLHCQVWSNAHQLHAQSFVDPRTHDKVVKRGLVRQIFHHILLRSPWIDPWGGQGDCGRAAT